MAGCRHSRLLMLHRNSVLMPLRGKRFQPHMQRSEMWGYKNDIGKGVLKERYKQQTDTICKRWFTMQYIYSVVFSELPYRYHPHNPTFRCAACGAEISCPFGASRTSHQF
ncbi:hypothetical protein Barb4_01387 [Bacteroidales bacterium Barb4]|nr:hypothetical protein Barb4_01387 [Bacteroidales bacterium Barb4]